MKKYIKYIKYILLCLVIIFVFNFAYSYKKISDEEKNNVEITISEKDKLLRVKYLLVDKEKTKEDIKIENTTNENSSLILDMIEAISILKKEGDYYVTKLPKVNEEITDNIVDYQFALNDVNGNAINDAKIDLKNKTVKIPEKYFDNNNSVQIETLSRISKKVKVNLYVNNKKRELLIDGKNRTTNISLDKYNKNKINEEDLSIYLNNKKVKVDNGLYLYDVKSGTLTIPISPYSLNEIYVNNYNNVFNKIVKNIINITNVKAERYDTVNDVLTKWKTLPSQIVSASNLEKAKVGTTFKVNVPYAYYDKSNGISGSSDDSSNESLYNNSKASPDYLCAEYNNDYFCGIVNTSTGEQGVNSEYLVDFAIDLSNVTLTSGDISLKFSNNVKLRLACAHVTSAAGSVNNNLPITITIAAITSDKMVFNIYADEKRFNQQAFGTYIFKIPENQKAKIKVSKKFFDGSTDVSDSISDKSGVTFGLYSDNTCSNQLKSGTTDTNGNLEFSDLKINTTYYVKETSLGSNFSSNDWEIDPDSTNKCHSISVSTTDDKENEIYYKSLRMDNRKKYYCYRAKKVDIENPECSIEGITFTNDETDEKTTGSDGIVTFDKLVYKDYNLKETSPNNTSATLHCENDKTYSYQYWNNNAYDLKITSNVLTKMIWDNYNYVCPDSATTSAAIQKDRRQYYCMKVKKVDAVTEEPLKGAKFKATNGSLSYEATTDSEGIATFVVGTNVGTYKITEIEAPEGYVLPSGDEISKDVPTTIMPSDTDYKTAADISKCNANAEEYIFHDSKILLNWYKETEQGTPVSGAEFKVSKENEYVTVKEKSNVTDKNGITKSCYQYNGMTSNASSASVLVSDSNGEVCISGLNSGTYTVKETKPVEYHTFDSIDNISISSNINFNTKNESNKFINYETIFEFNKSVSYGDGTDKIILNGVEKTFTELTTEELKKIEFEIYKKDSNGNPIGDALSFVLNNGVYEYDANNKDHVNGSTTTKLKLNDNRKITVKHLAWGDYIIKEVNSKTCGGTDDNCVGYYYPNNENEKTFTISSCSNPKANKTSCSVSSIVTQNMLNIPTEITFTKSDFYKYYDEKDIVDFENDKERSDFDRITFKLKDANGNYLTLKKIANHGNCLTDDSYSEYRYVYGDTTDSGGTELNTCGGHIKITNLCRGNNYTIEEIEVPEDSVFVKENTPSTPTEVNYTIPCKEGDISSTSNTNVINDKPTRVRFEKRDSKYNYLIPDETTTFQVYKCKKGTKCHPSDGITDDMELVKFSPRSVITNDEEDPNDEEGLAGVEVYRKLSDSDLKNGVEYVTELHPYHGILVLRYLEANYNYVLLETVAPKNYTLPIGRNAETEFTVTNTTVSVDEVDVPNKPTSLVIRKYDDKGNLLPGAEFKVYEGKTCDKNLSAMNQPKSLLKLKTIRDGVYESRPEQDTDTVITCKDKENSKCSDIPVNSLTKLTYTTYLDTWADFKESENINNEKIELQEGEALIQFLEYDHCYIIEEVKAPEGYSLPKKESDRFTMVTIEKNEKYVADTFKDLINKPTPFTFYKYDEYNNLIDGAEFKLQKLDDNKKYNDVTVTEVIENDKKYYKVDKETDNTLITTLNGSATVYYLSGGQYRIVETKAPEGKELTKNPNIATFFVDDSGNVYGNSIIVNKEKTSKIEVKSTASAELIVNIQTGQKVIKYSLIIAILIAIITGLMIVKNKEELEAKRDERIRRKNKKE